MRLSINKLSELTGHSRATVKKYLAGFQSESGEYESSQVLQLVSPKDGTAGGQTVSNAEAVRLLNIKRTSEIDLEMEIKRKERIPLALCQQINAEVCDSIGAVAKSCLNKTFTQEKLNEIFEMLRSIPDKLKW